MPEPLLIEKAIKKFGDYLKLIPSILWEYDQTNKRLFVTPNIEQIIGIKIPKSDISIDYVKRMLPRSEVVYLSDKLQSFLGNDETEMTCLFHIKNNMGDKIPCKGIICKENEGGGAINKLFGSVTPINIDGNDILLAKKCDEKKHLNDKVQTSQGSDAEKEDLKRKVGKLEQHIQELASSEEIFRQVAENSGDIYWLRTDEKILYINDRFETIWGRDKDIVMKDPYKLSEWIHPEDKENYENWVNMSQLVGGEPYIEQYRCIRPDGSMRWLWTRIFPVYDHQGKPYRIVGISTDITYQKKFEETLRIAKEKAQENDKLKSTFLANISHEIRTPMNGIVGFSELLSRTDINQEAKSKYVDIIKKSSEQLIRIIDDIIDFSKLESNQLKTLCNEFNLNGLMQEVYEYFINKINRFVKKPIVLNLEKSLDNPLALIISDEHRIRQVLYYLLDNAIKFTDNGEITMGYVINEDEKIEIYIKDTGIGVPNDKQDIIFERFRQADEGHKRKYGGTGLGLSISRAIVNLLGGNIWVRSDLGAGSKFSFTIPYVLSTENNEKEIYTEELIDPKYNWENKLVLVAEDDELNFEYIEALLEPTNIKIIRANNGSQAVKMCTNLSFDLILMDVRMPVMDGIQATKHLRNIGVKIPIIAQTAFAMDNDEENCISAGCNDYISKPINKELLYKKAHDLLFPG